MIEKIESYTQKNGNEILKVYCKPTSQLPDGAWFYTDSSARVVIEASTWRPNLNSRRDIINIIKRVGIKPYTHLELFHQTYANYILGYYPDYIDHVNGLEIDNIDENLNVVTNSQNVRNKPSRGYLFKISLQDLPYFETQATILGKKYYGGVFRNELDAFESTAELQAKYYSDYNYNFLKDRRGELNLLDLERTGVVSEEEATYRHVRRFVDTNPWYAYRYNLQEYCKDNHIVIPDFRLDEQGFMIHPITGKRFSPYEKEVLL